MSEKALLRKAFEAGHLYCCAHEGVNLDGPFEEWWAENVLRPLYAPGHEHVWIPHKRVGDIEAWKKVCNCGAVRLIYNDE